MQNSAQVAKLLCLAAAAVSLALAAGLASAQLFTATELGGMSGAGSSFIAANNGRQSVGHGLARVLSAGTSDGPRSNPTTDSVLVRLFAKPGKIQTANNVISNMGFQWVSNSSGKPGSPGVAPTSVPEPGILAMCAGVVVPVLGPLRGRPRR